MGDSRARFQPLRDGASHRALEDLLPQDVAPLFLTETSVQTAAGLAPPPAIQGQYENAPSTPRTQRAEGAITRANR